MKTFLCLLLLMPMFASVSRAQMLPKTSDIDTEIFPDGSINMSFLMTFDAAPWRQWKATVGDEPSRLRAMMRHEFAAMTLENFKLERDDMNRTAKMSMHSPVGPELRDDGSYQVPVDGYFRLINGAGQTWYFSGNNPNEGNALNNVKVTLPANALNAYVANPNNSDQALIFALVPPPSPLRWFYRLGAGLTVVGLLALLVAFLFRQPRVEIIPRPLRTLPTSVSMMERPPVIVDPPTPVRVVPPPIPTPQPPAASAYNEPD